MDTEEDEERSEACFELYSSPWRLGQGFYSRRLAARQTRLELEAQDWFVHDRYNPRKRIKLDGGYVTSVTSAEQTGRERVLPSLHIPSPAIFSSTSDLTKIRRATIANGIEHSATQGPDLSKIQNRRNPHSTPISPAGLEQMDQLRLTQSEKPFNMIDGFAQDKSLLFSLISVLPIPSLIDLYAISKSFFRSFNDHATASILASADTWSPNAKRIFPWRCYLSLCIKDPVLRQQSRPKDRRSAKNSTSDSSTNGASLHDNTIEELIPTDEELIQNARDVPSLRWLQMVAWRHGVAKDIIEMLRSKGALISLGPGIDVIKVSLHNLHSYLPTFHIRIHAYN
jgi:hypothetical protein